jgi:hypothetical protein
LVGAEKIPIALPLLEDSLQDGVHTGARIDRRLVENLGPTVQRQLLRRGRACRFTWSSLKP